MKLTTIFSLSIIAIGSFSLCNAANQTSQAQTKERVSNDKQQQEFLRTLILPGEKHMALVKFLSSATGLGVRAIFWFILSVETIKRNLGDKIFDQKKGMLMLLSSIGTLGTLESFGTVKFQNWAMPHETDQFVAGCGGIIGSILYKAYHWLVLSNKICLNRTIEAFSKTPKKFPTQATEVLQGITKSIDVMTPKEIADYCGQLRAIATA